MVSPFAEERFIPYSDPKRRAAYQKAYRKTHRKKRNAQTAAWRHKHPEKQAEYNTAWYTANTALAKSRTSSWRKANPERVKQYLSDFYTDNPKAKRVYSRRYVESTYGLSKGEYDAKLAEQRGLCAICQRPETAKARGGGVRRLSIDHNHSTDKVRALLCSACNTALGIMNEDPSRLRTAATYLEHHNKHN